MRFVLAAICIALLDAYSNQEYSIEPIRLANSPGDSLASLVVGTANHGRIVPAYIVWLTGRGGRKTFCARAAFVACVISSTGLLGITCYPTQPRGYWREGRRNHRCGERPVFPQCHRINSAKKNTPIAWERRGAARQPAHPDQSRRYPAVGSAQYRRLLTADVQR